MLGKVIAVALAAILTLAVATLLVAAVTDVVTGPVSDAALLTIQTVVPVALLVSVVLVLRRRPGESPGSGGD